ncbi:hydrogenase maturation nickel metallochaperone HypA [Aneurinibacillus terranovensis]|uniref:hydrogenase maturation nickel metallochaperone HypA/HybF n=1 Tax=Aneurinibacillus terranovensis TaxID=278991 RepID=UPI0004044401|nr:hydrogenase maturation nickel metallochaperone HypA [Aneurinibacillus terranovensis]
MHEMSLMESALTMVRTMAGERDIKSVREICLKVGELSNAMPDALTFAYDVLHRQKEFQVFSSCILRIEWEETRAECQLCGTIYQPDQKLLQCPSCHMPGGVITQGEDLQVLYFEGE